MASEKVPVFSEQIIIFEFLVAAHSLTHSLTTPACFSNIKLLVQMDSSVHIV
jgi:hypothetical protein